MIEKPIITPKEAVALVKAGNSVMCGGFMGAGAAETLSKAMAEHCPHKDLTLIASDHSWGKPDIGRINGVAHMVQAKLFNKCISCHIGLDAFTQEQMKSGEMDVNLFPMGSFVEKIRSAGLGIGGFYTPSGLGTEVAEGKEIKVIQGKEYILEEALSGDVAFIKAKKADKAGNLIYEAAARNFNPILAMAAKIVIAEVEEIVEIGELDPNHIQTPFIFVHYLVLGGN